MATASIIVGDWSFLPDNPIGVTFGVNGANAYKSFAGGASDQLFSDVLALGASRIRFNCVREAVETAQGVFDWSGMDHMVWMANKNGIRVTLLARGFPGSGPPSWASIGSPCSPGGTKTYTTAAAYAEYATALAQRYSGDGNAKNATTSKDANGNFLTIGQGGTGLKLQGDSIEVGNEDFNVGGGGSNPNNGGCSDALRYVYYVRTVLPVLRAPTSQSFTIGGITMKGGNWNPRSGKENFLARVGQWGHLTTKSQSAAVSTAQSAVQDSWHKMTNPNYNTSDPMYSTWNPSGSGNSIFGYDANLGCQLLDYANFHNYSDPYNDGVSEYDHGAELDDIRAILNAAGNTTTPIWCTESGEEGPAGGASATKQSAFYAANTNGSGAGVLATMKAHGLQHYDIFTMNYADPTGDVKPYLGETKSIACKDSSSPTGYVQFLAFSTIQNYFSNVDKGAWAAQAVPKGFGNQPSGGGGGGGGSTGGSLVGSFAPLGNNTVNLTTEGTGDWAHAGITGTTYDHKSTGGSQISTFSTVGNGSAVQNPNALLTSIWSDGTPDASGNTATGIKQQPPQKSGGSSGTPNVMVVALENHNYDNSVYSGANYIKGNSNFPHINSLLTTYGYCTKFYAITHPSLPNYISFASGSTQGVTNDTYNPASSPLPGGTLVSQLDAAGINWKHYAEALPSAGYLGGDSGSYVQHHNPWVYFKNFRNATSSYQQAHLVNYSDASVGLSHDLTNNVAPPFIFVQPTNNDNGHNSGNDSTCDNFVNSLVSTVQASSWYTNGGMIVLWWDEANPDADTAGIGDASPGGGHVMCVVISANNSGATMTSNINHYGMLRALQKLYGLSPYLNDAAHTTNGDLTPLLGTGSGGGGASTSNLGNGFSFTAPADTNPRTLKVYVDANAGIGTFVASLSDGSAPDYLDSSLNNTSGATAGIYTLNYAAASSGQTLKVTYTLSSGVTPGTTKSSDTFNRANQSGLGTASGGGTWTTTNEVGTPSWSISSNSGKLTSANVGDTGVALLSSQTVQDGEAVTTVNLGSLTSGAGLVLRATSGAASYYRASLTGSTITLAYVTGGASTVLSSQPATLKAGTNYGLRFRILKNCLYAKYWDMSGTEPANWNVFAKDSTLTAAGQYGIRGVIGAANDILLYDTYSVSDLSAVGDPSYVSLYAADIPTTIVTSSGSLSGSHTTPSGTINLTTEGVNDWAHWGFGSATAFDHKANVTQQISNFTGVGSGTDTQESAAIINYTWTDGTPDAAETATATGTIVQGVSNGFSFTVPADTTSRTINVYVEAIKAQGELTATLSDGSASAYTDSSLNDSGTGSVLKYTIVYNAASANQTLTVQWVMQTDNGSGGSSTTYAADTFARPNQTNWGTASDGTDTWAQNNVSGSPAFSIASNTGKITASATATGTAFLGSGTQANAIALVRLSLSSNSSSSAAILLRATSANTYYRFNIFSPSTLQIAKVVSGTVTTLISSTSITYSANTNYWMKAEVNGSNLMVKFWQDGTSEPSSWTLTTTDSSITGAGQYGLRSKIDTSGDVVKFDSYSITSIPTGGTPGSLELHAVSLVGAAPTSGGGGGGGNPPPPSNALQVQILQANALSTPFLGVGVEIDPYTIF